MYAPVDSRGRRVGCRFAMTMEAEGPLCFVDGAKAAYTHALKKLTSEGGNNSTRWALVGCAAFLSLLAHSPSPRAPVPVKRARCHKRATALSQQIHALPMTGASLVRSRVRRSAVCRHLVQLAEAAGEDEETFKQAVQMAQLLEVRTADVFPHQAPNTASRKVSRSHECRPLGPLRHARGLTTQGMPVVDVPSHEASWLLCTSWNRGLGHLQAHRPTWAAKWMKLALLKLVDMPCLHVERTRYKETMRRIYQEVCYPLKRRPRLTSSFCESSAATRPNGIRARSQPSLVTHMPPLQITQRPVGETRGDNEEAPGVHAPGMIAPAT